MELSFITATFINLIINLIYTVIALIVGILVLRFIDKHLLTKIDIQQELKNNNMAVAVFTSTILLFVALIICFGLKG